MPWRKGHCTVIPFVVIFFALICLAFARYICIYFYGFKKAKKKQFNNLGGGKWYTNFITYADYFAIGFFLFVLAIVFLIMVLGAFKNPTDYIVYGTAVFMLIYFIAYETNSLERSKSELDKFASNIVEEALTQMIN